MTLRKPHTFFKGPHDPNDWLSGDDEMTIKQDTFLQDLSRAAGVKFEPDLTKAGASTRIKDLLKLLRKRGELGKLQQEDVRPVDAAHRHVYIAHSQAFTDDFPNRIGLPSWKEVFYWIAREFVRSDLASEASNDEHYATSLLNLIEVSEEKARSRLLKLHLDYWDKLSSAQQSQVCKNYTAIFGDERANPKDSKRQAQVYQSAKKRLSIGESESLSGNIGTDLQ